MEYLKVEIIIDNLYLQDLLELMERLGVKGYTAMDITRGKGLNKGEHLQEGLLPTTRKTLLFTIVDKVLANLILNQVQPFLDERVGVLILYKIEYASGLNVIDEL